MKPRQYQTDAIDACMEPRTKSVDWPVGRPRLVVLPTGTGKGALQIWLAERATQESDKPYLSVQPDLDIMAQACARFQRAGFRVVLEQAENRGYQTLMQRNLFADEAPRKTVMVASSKSLGRNDRLKLFPRDAFCGGHIEEAHHSTAPYHRKILAWFNSVPWTGDTATPQRVGMGDLWEVVYNDMTFADAIKLGWLTNTEWRSVTVPDWDWSRLKQPRNGAEVSSTDLRDLLIGDSGDRLIGNIVARLVYELRGRTCMSFWPSVPSAQVASDRLNAHRIKTYAMVGVQAQGGMSLDTLRSIRADALARARRGEIRHLTLCQLGAEGVDNPDLETVAILRAVCSEVLAAQIYGRCARPHSTVAHLLSDSMSAAERRALIAASPKPRAEVLMFVGVRAKVNMWRPTTLVHGLDDLPDDEMARALNGGVTVEELEAIGHQRELDKQEQAAALEREEFAREQARRNGRPQIDVPSAHVVSYTLEEMRVALENPSVTDSDISRWKRPNTNKAGRVATDGQACATDAQRKVLSGMLTHLTASRLRRSRTVSAHDIVKEATKAGHAIYLASQHWTPGGAYNEYKYLSRKMRNKAPKWPSKTRKQR